MKNTLVLVAFILLCTSCENILLPLISRTLEDPFDDVPITDSFTTAKTVYLQWQDDAAADEYILMRANDNNPSQFSEIYRGESLSYIDTSIVEGGKYHYRLDKLRGELSFSGKNTALGASSSLTNDRYEPNSTELNATLLDYKCEASMYVYSYSNGRYLEDIDWYKVVLPARRSVAIALLETGLSDGLTSFYFSQPGVKDKELLLQDTSVSLTNHSEQTKTLYFKISPNRDVFTDAVRHKSYTLTVKSVF